MGGEASVSGGVSSPLAVVHPLPPAPCDQDGWRTWLRQQLITDWRAGERDATVWLFTRDPNNPATNCGVCAVQSCDSVTNGRTLCASCERARHRSEMDRDTFIRQHRPSTYKRHIGRAVPQCIVVHDRARCERASTRGSSGLCLSHYSMWRQRGTGLSAQQWAAGRARPLGRLDPCLVPGCPRQRRVSVPLCQLHLDRWRRDHPTAPADNTDCTTWAARQLPYLAAHQFSLTPLAETVRVEVLYGLQRRDSAGKSIDVGAVRHPRRRIQLVVATPRVWRCRWAGRRGG